MRFSNPEILDLAKAWFAISLAFAIVIGGMSFMDIFQLKFLVAFVLAGVTVGIAFLFHELAHKLLAQRYGCQAEFKSDDKMLLIAVIFSFLGFVFVAPGGVIIHGRIKKHEFGLVSTAGVLTNLVLGVLSLAIWLGLGVTIFHFAAQINLWLATFNLLPFGQFDGLKVLWWNKKVYFGLAFVTLTLLFFSSFL